MIKFRDINKSLALHAFFISLLVFVNFSFNKPEEIVIPIELLTISSSEANIQTSETVSITQNASLESAFQIEGESPHLEQSIPDIEPNLKSEPIPQKTKLTSFKVESNQKSEKAIGQKKAIQKAQNFKSKLITKRENLSETEKYEQILAIWFTEQSKKLNRDTEFEHEYAIIRIRINHRGKILFSKIEEPQLPQDSYIYTFLYNLIKVSNPVPPVPETYSKDKELEFLVPVKF